MTREEQIIQESIKKYPRFPERRIGFIDGTQWEHKRIVEKACEWMKQSMYVEYIFEYNEDEKPVQYVCASACDSVDKFVDNFRKAMEE